MPKKKADETHSSRCLSVKPTLEQERDLQIIQNEEGATKSEMMRDALTNLAFSFSFHIAFPVARKFKTDC